jgi:3-hydroxymyristoyl/3-hydroxydecanoyl-(acyl carrier protein) dehydratase
MSFVFVDRITDIDSAHARGEFDWQLGVPLPQWLVIEAVGQLAAWITMARCDFAVRPVAALVGEVRLNAGAERGGPLVLDAQIDRLDSRAVLYSGSARCGGSELIALRRCVGPLLPTDSFDDPAALRRRFTALCGGATSAARDTDTLPQVAVTMIDAADAQLRIPTTAEFFADHFPRRPVYPATLLAEAQNQLGLRIAARLLDAAPGRVRLFRIGDFKVRAFSPPGQVLELSAHSRPRSEDTVAVETSVQADGRRIASATFSYCTTP